MATSTIQDGSVGWKIVDTRKGSSSSSGGGSSTGSGEANKINSISVDGVNQTIDSNKNVNISLSEYTKTTNLKTAIGNASSTNSGLMSAADKSKLDNLATSSSSSSETIEVFSTTKNGLVPKSDGSLYKFLRADGEWVEIKEPENIPILVFDKNNIVLNDNNLVETINITTNSDGNISVLNSNENVCTMSYDNNTKKITVTASNSGSSEIVVSISSTNTYKAIVQTITVIINIAYSPILSENSPAQLQQAARDGTASSLWSVGEIFNIKLNGILGSQLIENVEVGLQIIGFNHNVEIEGNNTIHFQCGVKDGMPIALYWENGAPFLEHHTTSTNIGGWEQSDLRTIVCPQFYNCLPQEWQDVIQTTTKYTDNLGNNSSTSSQGEVAVTVTEDKVFLLSSFEVKGSSSMFCNSYEKYKQQQYDYYIFGPKYRDKTGTWSLGRRGKLLLPSNTLSSASTLTWWLRSPAYSSGLNDSAGRFCIIEFKDGFVSEWYNTALIDTAFSPAFAIG